MKDFVEATNLLVQHTDHEFVLSFFETAPPIVLNEKDFEIDKVTAECVARVVIAPKRMQQFIDTLQKSLEKYNLREAEKGDE